MFSASEWKICIAQVISWAFFFLLNSFFDLAIAKVISIIVTNNEM